MHQLLQIERLTPTTIKPLPKLDKTIAVKTSTLFTKQTAPSITDENLKSTVIAIHYAKAEDLAKFIGNTKLQVLSTRGKIYADTRTNSLWIRDMANKIKSIKRLIQTLDIPVKQILIKARIVDVDDQYTKSLGMLFKKLTKSLGLLF